MKLGRRALSVAGLVLLVLGVLYSPEATLREEKLLTTKTCRVPATVLRDGAAKHTIVVLHGLSADRKLMLNLGSWLASDATSVYLLDLPGHGDNPDPFSLARAEACAAEVLELLAVHGDLVPERTALVGHSMGGGIAIRLANRFPVAATIAISPGVGRLPRRIPANLLVLTGEFDFPQLKCEAQKIASAAGGTRTEAEDFAQKRAFELLQIPHTTHTSFLFDPEAGRKIRAWLAQSLPGYPAGPERVVLRGTFASLSGLLGLVFLFPAAAALVLRVFRPASQAPAGMPPAARIAVAWAAAALLAVAVLWLWVPLGWLRIYDGDYLASYLFLAGLALLLLLAKTGGSRAASLQESASNRGRRPVMLRDGHGILTGTVTGLATMLVFGAWVNGWLYDLWLNPLRWWRFAAMLPFLLPYFIAEELALGPPESTWRGRLRRYALFSGLRGILAAVLLVPIFLLGSGPVLALLLMPYLALFSLLQRMAADRLRTNSLAAAAVFSAILAAWFVAAVMPIT